MKSITLGVAALLLASVAAEAQFRPLTQDGAPNAFGDDKLSYFGGVVYDDDLVPGFGPNQPFLIEEQVLGTSRITTRDPLLRSRPVMRRAIRPNSRQLIGADGKVRR
ncbi:MAG: hypothetical protein AAF318_00160 [Pseudomonadota bacterium]